MDLGGPGHLTTINIPIGTLLVLATAGASTGAAQLCTARQNHQYSYRNIDDLCGLTSAGNPARRRRRNHQYSYRNIDGLAMISIVAAPVDAPGVAKTTYFPIGKAMIPIVAAPPGTLHDEQFIFL